MADEAQTEGATPAGDDDALRRALHQIEGVLRSQHEVVTDVGALVAPAWRRVTAGEPRWPVSLGILAALAMQVTLPEEVVMRPRWLLPSVAGALLVGLVAANPRRIDRHSTSLRVASMLLIAIVTLSNAWSAGRLVDELLRGTATNDATRLLLTGGAIWLTNVIAFALWFWELDRGGPARRANAVREHPDFLFAQMQNPELAADDWEPRFVDYVYLAFTNAAAFSPTDVLPLSRWAKLTMLVQSAISLATVVLVVARAVNTLR